MTRLSVSRLLRTNHFWAMVLFANVPVLLAALIFSITMVHGSAGDPGPGRLLDITHGIFVAGYLHLCVIFTAVGFGATVVRQEMEEQTFHYFLLTPMPRWIMVAGKYTGFLLAAGPVFLLSLLTMNLLIYGSHGAAGLRHFATLPVLGGLLAQGGVLLVALAVYSALFMALGSLFRNVLYGLLVYAWEISANFMPESLRNFTLSWHIKSMLPFRTTDRPSFIGILTEHPGNLQIFLVLTSVFVVCTLFAGWFASRKECVYGGG